MTQEPDLIFRKELPFYQMVSTASISLSGFPFFFATTTPVDLKPKDYIELKGIVGNDRHLMPYEVRRKALAGHISKDDYLGTICMMLVNTAYESVSDKKDYSPEFEFFRHVRNASSHLNRFRFTPNEPMRPASWRGVAIDHTKKGTDNLLHNTHCFGRLLGVADVFGLLWDIEQIIVSQQSSVAEPSAAAGRRGM